MKFFVDNCISPTYVRALQALAEIQAYEIVHLREKFDESAKDVDWIRKLAEEGDWVIVSGDPRITRGKAEKEAWRESGLTAFFFTDDFGTRSYWKQALDLVKWWPDIVLESRKCIPGSGFLIPVKAKGMKLIYEPK